MAMLRPRAGNDRPQEGPFVEVAKLEAILEVLWKLSDAY
jgi:hypothetical protein